MFNVLYYQNEQCGSSLLFKDLLYGRNLKHI